MKVAEGWLLRVVAGGIMAFLLVPLVVVVAIAFTSSSSLTFPPDGLSLRWFDMIFSDDAFRTAFSTSLRLALASSVIAGIGGTAFAVAATRRRDPLFAATSAIALAPILLPGIFIGVALFATLTLAGARLSVQTALLGQLIYVVPFVILIANARLRDFDLALEEAARNAGYSRAATFRFVTLPIVLPSLLAAMVLAFAISFDEFFITFFVIGEDTTLPIYILSRLRIGIDPSVNAVATVLLILPIILVAPVVASSQIRQALVRR